MRKNAKHEAKEIIDKANAESRAILYTIEDNKEKIKKSELKSKFFEIKLV